MFEDKFDSGSFSLILEKVLILKDNSEEFKLF
jgi:hypothetical protein